MIFDVIALILGFIWRKINWFFERFADLPFLLVMIASVFWIRQMIAEYDPQAALSYLDVWDRVAQAGALTAAFSLAFFAFMYFNYRILFKYLYPERRGTKFEVPNIHDDFKNLQPWQRLISIPLLFGLLLWLFQLSLRVMQAMP